MKEYFLSWGMLFFSVVFNACGVFVIKWRLNELGAIQTDSFKAMFNYGLLMLKSPLVLFGVVLFFLAPFLFAIALSRMEITVAYPAQIALNFLILLVLAVLFLGENMTLNKTIGIMLVIVSIYFFHK